MLDLDTLALVGEIGPGAGVHGVALAPELGRGFVSNGQDATITVFDLATRAILGRWPTGGKKPDAILYDPASRRLFSFNGETDNATAFDAATGRIVGSVALGGAPEFAVSDEAGGIYVNIEDRGETVRFDARTLAITARWPLAPAHTPTGLALDREHRRLFVGCRSQQLVVLQAETGAVIASLPARRARRGRGVVRLLAKPGVGLQRRRHAECLSPGRARPVRAAPHRRHGVRCADPCARRQDRADLSRHGRIPAHAARGPWPAPRAARDQAGHVWRADRAAVGLAGGPGNGLARPARLWLGRRRR